MTRRPGLPALASLVLVGGAALAGCTGSDDPEPTEPAPVALAPDGAPDELTLGVVVSLTSAPGEGAQWFEAAHGAEVAAERYRIGGSEVVLALRDDRGTSEGLDQAVRELAEEGVAGIVLATEGQHLTAGLTAADELGVPVVLPYAGGSGDLPATAFALAPSDEQVGAALDAALAGDGLDRPALLDVGGGLPAGLDVEVSREVADADDVDRAARSLAREVARDRVDAVVVSGPAVLQAEAVESLQSAGATVPLLLTPDALSPDFAAALTEAGGSTSTPLTTAGVDSGDVLALSPGARGESVSAFLAAVRSTAGADVATYVDEQPFSTVAGAADAASHDAVVTLVTAAAAAGSAAPSDVLDALASLVVDAGDGLVGPALDLGSRPAVADEAVVPLRSTAQDPGLRQVAQAPGAGLFWFSLPTD